MVRLEYPGVTALAMLLPATRIASWDVNKAERPISKAP
tara:strand:- start:735 stop:848 length:114 start_codon:yes stop_codon:yes gene_type:complete